MKTILRNKTDFDNFILIHTRYDSYRGDIVSYLSEPEKYPCVLVYTIRYDDNGPDYIDGEYVYHNDFEKLQLKI